MKRKLLSLLLITCCMGVSACSLPFGKDSETASSTETVTSVESTEPTSTVEEEKAKVEYATEDMLVIRVLKTEGEEKLLEVMAELQTDGAFTFVESGGMITTINGKENAADWSACWMLYTSDEELSNTAWGEVEYNGAKLGSAIVGAGELPVAEGQIYVWSYQGF